MHILIVTPLIVETRPTCATRSVNDCDDCERWEYYGNDPHEAYDKNDKAHIIVMMMKTHGYDAANYDVSDNHI